MREQNRRGGRGAELAIAGLGGDSRSPAAHNAEVAGDRLMKSVLVALVIAAALAQPKLRPAPDPRPIVPAPEYVPIPLPSNVEQLLRSMQFDETNIPPEL